MRPTPLEVRTASFRRVRRGYDPAEVDSLLQRVADRYEGMWRDRQELEQKLTELQKETERVEKDARALADRLKAAREHAAARPPNSEPA